MTNAGIQMAANNPTLPRQSSELEADFGFEELFFSRTDSRGKITSGNTVFQRVSKYDWSELLEKPHNVIRHPDMPKGVFWLLWDRIRKGLPTGAYVKNKSKDGRYYWVYAIITPIADGYLSVHLKPGSALFAQVQKEYRDLLRAEQDQDLTPAKSAEALLSRLKQLGFRDYQSFMTKSLLEEELNRAKVLSKKTATTISRFQELLLASEKLLETATAVAGTYHDFRFVPLNLIIQAGQLGKNGAAIGTISNNYSLLAEEIKLGLGGFFDAARQVSDTISEGAFLLSTSGMQEEIANAIATEDKASEVDHVNDLNHLNQQRAHYSAKALENLSNIQRDLEVFAKGTGEIKRLTSGLAAVRIMGKVEAGRLSSSVLNDLITDLDSFQHILSKGLTEIQVLNSDLSKRSGQLLSAHAAETRAMAA
jgi:predicted transposase YbfD/YdcC